MKQDETSAALRLARFGLLLGRALRHAPPALLAMTTLAVCTSAWVALRSDPVAPAGSLWMFSAWRAEVYRDAIDRWAREKNAETFAIQVVERGVLTRRLVSGFTSGTPVADLIEIDIDHATATFAAPLADIGYLDLAPWMRDSELAGQIPPAALTPWTLNGRVFGLPVAVHPVALAYRADIVEAAGIDLTQAQTWDDFVRLLRPLQRDDDGDGQLDRYLLNLWPTGPGAPMTMSILIHQAGGRFITEDHRVAFDSEVVARVLATIVSWCAGPNRIAIDTPEISAPGNALKLQGRVIACLAPDWLCGAWKRDLPDLAGKWKLMPLPAWTPGGLRTSVHGGTMLAVNRDSPRRREAVALALALYRNRDVGAALFRQGRIVSAYRPHWDHPVFAEPDPYFAGQVVGRFFTELIAEVPARETSPFLSAATFEVSLVLSELALRADATGRHDVESLLPEARRLLGDARQRLERTIQRNRLLQSP